MNETTKILIIIAISLILLGGIIFVCTMSICGWDFTRLSMSKYDTKTYEISEEIKNLSIVTSTTDVEILPSDDSKITVICYEQEKTSHQITVSDGTIAIEQHDTRKFYEYIGFNFGQPKISIYLPKGEYEALTVAVSTGDINIANGAKFKSISVSGSTGDVSNYASVSESIKISISTGDIFMENVNADSLDLTVSTGKINASKVMCNSDVKIKVSTGKTYLTDIKCDNFTTEGNTGDIFLNNVIAENKLTIERSTGNVHFDGCDAGEIFVQTDTGKVKGSLLSEKVFIPRSDTGDIEVPETKAGGVCKIITDTGDIEITIK